jgi:HlyD family secretion protein
MVGALLPRPPPPARRPQTAPANGGPRVWVLRDGAPEAVPVTTGATNGRVTEITGGGLAAGAEVITEMLGPAR